MPPPFPSQPFKLARQTGHLKQNDEKSTTQHSSKRTSPLFLRDQAGSPDPIHAVFHS